MIVPAFFTAAVVLVLLLVGNSVTTTTAFVVAPAILVSGRASSMATTTTDLQMTVLVYKGKKKDFPPGSPLSRAAASLGVPVKYSCKKLSSGQS